MPGKYNVSPATERRFLGRTSGSKAERRYHEMLEEMVKLKIVIDYICQPRVWLGVEENIYVPDFLVIPDGAVPHYVDVKGVETPKFKHDKKLWASYGRAALHIVKETSPAKFKTSEIIEGGRG